MEIVGPLKLIIAMKGHPGTGKSTLAHSLAASLRCPLIDKDDVRDCTAVIQESHASPSTIAKLLNDFSYDVIWRIAGTQLALGLSVVIDSPLSRRSHLDRLLELEALYGAHVIIIECRPHDENEWRRRLERRGAGPSVAAGWHKPATWQDLQKLLDGYAGCSDYDVGDVPKLTVDTTAPVEVGELVSAVLQFIMSHSLPASRSDTHVDSC
uniref:P-loop containing nucleoside triphosphate hydrolase protein n=1 Tax=Nelumbo nucifera TaxID=4432 RepID=A0A822ZC78_NELNU|nr:TPA_asm: hypothetical protein HUJ06_002054 [Nelumbo nucifera]